MKKVSRALKLCIVLALSLGTVVLLINFFVIASEENNITEAPCEKYSCIIVLGAGLKPDGSPSHMLEDRIIRAVELYKSGASDIILMSGDHSSESYNEVGAMKSYAMSLGVPDHAIVCDGMGFSTYESVWRAKEIFGYSSAIIVTQEYHLYRALYISNELGLDSVGVSASLRKYKGQIWNDLRESLARCKDIIYTAAKPEYR